MRLFSKFFLFVFTLLYFANITHSQSAAFDNAIDSLFRVHYSDTTVGVSIGVVFKNPNTGEFVRKLYYHGEKNRATHEAPDSTTVYQIGSVTKTFTAMVMAHMLKNNLANRHDLIQSYLGNSVRIPYWVNGTDTTKINILELVTHFSGLIDEPPGISYPYTIQHMFSYLDTCHLLSKPDSLWSYSNIGFATLATGLTVKAGRDSIEQLYQQWITDSLGMPDTKITRTLSMILRSAKGYIKNNSNVWVLADSNKSTWPAFNGAGAIRSTIKDMMRYLEYQMKLLNSTLNPLLDSMHKRIKQIDPSGPLVKCQGMAWATNHLLFHPQKPWIIFKDGGTPGYNSFITFYTDTVTGVKGGVVILSNSGTSSNFSNATYIEALSMDILNYMHTRYSAIGIEPIGTEISENFRLEQNYPNPFNPGTTIEFSIPYSKGMSGSLGMLSKLIVYDITGKEVETLFAGELKPGKYKVDFDASQLTSGVYFYKLSAGNFIETKKMLMIK